MRKITALCLLILLSSFFPIQSQNIDNQYQKIGTIKGEFLTCDINENIYLIDYSSLYKLDGSGKLLATYSDLFLGEITSIDVSNPLKIMVFYRDAGKILFLDDKLVVISETIDLFAQNFYNISLAAFSTDNRIWLFDRTKQELISVDFQLKVLQKNSLTIDQLNPTQLLTLKEENVLMQNSNGILFFDNFGTYLKTIAIQTDSPVQINDNFIYYLYDNQLFAYNYKKLQQITLRTFDTPVRQAVFVHGKIFYIDNDRSLNSILYK